MRVIKMPADFRRDAADTFIAGFDERQNEMPSPLRRDIFAEKTILMGATSSPDITT